MTGEVIHCARANRAQEQPAPAPCRAVVVWVQPHLLPKPSEIGQIRFPRIEGPRGHPG